VTSARTFSIRAVSVDPDPLQEVDLVLHQRDQCRNHDRHSLQQRRRQLIAEALARPGRKDCERRSAGEQCLDDLLLPGAKGIEAEPRCEDVQWTPA